MKKSLIFMLFCLLLQNSTCVKKKYCENDLKFKINFTLTPKDTFRIGDTLWVETIVPDTLLDFNSQNLLSAPNIPLATEFFFDKLDKNTGSFGTHLFSVLPKVGNVKFRNPGTLMCVFDTIGRNQQLQIGFIPQKAGIYAFVPNFTFDGANQNVNIMHNGCTDIVNIVYRTNQGNSNYQFLKLFSADSLTQEHYIKSGIYGFAVIPR